MPQIDLSVVLTSPMLSDTFTVLRRPQTVQSNGRVLVGPVEPIPNIRGVVQAVTPDDLRREPDQQHMTKTISIACIFRLRGPSKDSQDQEYQPDQIVWHGNTYVVTNVGDYSGFGAGFTVSTAASIDSTDAPPP